MTGISYNAGVFVVTCGRHGHVSTDRFELSAHDDAIAYLNYRKSKGDNWGKCFTIRHGDGRYIFNEEFQQRT